MTINLDTEIVATGYDPLTQTCTYTIERDGKRWTASIPLAHLDGHGPGAASAQKRREHVARVLETAMQGPHDGEKPQ